MPQLVNEHAGVRVAVGSRWRHRRYGELGVVPLRHQARVRHRLCVSANKMMETREYLAPQANEDIHAPVILVSISSCRETRERSFYRLFKHLC